jgi:hypothetical protein
MSLFPSLPVVVPLADQIECIEREIRFRERVYSRRVAAGKMTQALMDRELARMRAVLATLQELEGK